MKLNLQVTSNCNMNCKFCSDIFKHQKERGVCEVLEVVDKIPNGCFDLINITGGEPLLYKDISILLKEINKRNYKVGLETNGLLLKDNLTLLEYIDEITLPLDSGLMDTLTNMGRNNLQLFITAKNISLIKDINPAIKIKISTVLTKKNISEVESLAGLVELLYFDEWEVHQFIPHGEGKYNIEEFILGDKEFNSAINYLLTTSASDKLTPISVGEKIDNGWLITPNLNLVKLTDDKALSYGNSLNLSNDLYEDIFKRKKYCKLK